MVNKKGAFIVSQGLADVTDSNDVSDSVVKANVSEQKQPSYPASSSGEQPSLEWLNAEIARLEDENEKLMTSVKQNKKTISDFKQLVKDKVIEVDVRMLSGRSFQVQTKSGKTVKQFKTQDLDAHYTYEEHLFLLVIGGQVLQNNKRLHSYGVCDGSYIDENKGTSSSGDKGTVFDQFHNKTFDLGDAEFQSIRLQLPTPQGTGTATIKYDKHTLGSDVYDVITSLNIEDDTFFIQFGTTETIDHRLEWLPPNTLPLKLTQHNTWKIDAWKTTRLPFWDQGDLFSGAKLVSLGSVMDQLYIFFRREKLTCSSHR